MIRRRESTAVDNFSKYIDYAFKKDNNVFINMARNKKDIMQTQIGMYKKPGKEDYLVAFCVPKIIIKRRGSVATPTA